MPVLCTSLSPFVMMTPGLTDERPSGAFDTTHQWMLSSVQKLHKKGFKSFQKAFRLSGPGAVLEAHSREGS